MNDEMMSDPLRLTRGIIKEEGLPNWLDEFPWLHGYLGNPHAPVWFVAENPSLKGVRDVEARAVRSSPNLQWTCGPGTASRLLRDALTGAGLKAGDPCEDAGWHCYITNADKEPQEVSARNKGKTGEFMRKQAERWMPVLQAEIDRGDPHILVALGGQAEKLLAHMRRVGLRAPRITRVHHYSYIWLRPESGSKRGPRHPERVAEFMDSVRRVAKEWGAGPVPATDAPRTKPPKRNETPIGTVDILRAFDFAARHHSGQHRKGEAEEPYINHVIEVARLLAEATDGLDPILLMGGALHDTVEDTDVTEEDLVREFGDEVAALVGEVTDDKSLEKQVRKRLQIETASRKSDRAKMIKLADKISNLRSIVSSPPQSWDTERKQDYFEWAQDVASGCRGVNAQLEAWFDEAYRTGHSL